MSATDPPLLLTKINLETMKEVISGERDKIVIENHANSNHAKNTPSGEKAK